MTTERSQRRLSNIKLTGKYHYRYMGLWILITIGLIIVINVLLFRLAEEHWQALYTLDTPFHDQYMAQRQMMMMALGFATILLSTVIVLLAKTTAHRVAGPYIKLQRVFESVSRGNLNQELHFRQYDHLEELETAFNTMMAEIRARAAQKEPPA